MPLVPETVPTTETMLALTEAVPVTVSAGPALESSYRLQLMRLSCAPPLTDTPGLALGSRLSTQPVPAFPMATARAEMATGPVPNSDDNSRCCGWLTMTSTASGVAM